MTPILDCIKISLILILYSCYSYADDICDNNDGKIVPQEGITYPSGWNSSLPAPVMQSSCFMKFIIPTGYAAFVSISSNVSESIEFLHTNGYRDRVIPGISSTPFFAIGGFAVDVNISKNKNSFGMTFGMTVKLMKYDAKTPTTWDLNSSPKVIKDTDCYNGYILRSQYNVSLLSSPSNVLFPNLSPYMRSQMIFEGDAVNETNYIGSAYDIYVSNTDLVSTSKQLFIINVFNNSIIGNRIIAHDKENVLNIKGSFQAKACTYCYQYELDATNGTAALISVNSEPDYVSSIRFDDPSASLDVYFDNMSPASVIASYSQRDITSRLPQQVQGTLRYYILDKGKATIEFTSSNSDWIHPKPGRRGFITSQDYRNSLAHQDSQVELSSTQKYLYTIHVRKDISLASNESLVLRIDYKSHVETDTYYLNSPPFDHNVSFKAYGLSIAYTTGEQPSTGFYLDYFVENGSSVRMLAAGLFIILINLMNML